jgi:hypothetical protein
MLRIIIPDSELFNENTQEFFTVKGQTITLEHSLLSLSKWESKWHKPFLNNKDLTPNEVLDYIRCMTLTKNVDPQLYLSIPEEVYSKIQKYMDDTMTATWFDDKKSSTSKSQREIVTSEIIYYWMITLGIPLECEKWHINRLLTLIKVCQIKNTPGKKMSRREILSQNHLINEQRKHQLHTKG